MKESGPISPEFTVVLVPGINVVEVPRFPGRRLKTNPFYIPSQEGVIPGSKNEELSFLSRFLEYIQQQDGRLVQILEVPYTSNFEEVDDLGDEKIETLRVAIVYKD